MSVRRVLLVVSCAVSIATTGWAGSKPVAVSPGSPTGALIEGRCPTFSWGSVEGARSYELVVYRLGEEGEDARPVLRQSFAGSVASWTPSLDRCLERGGRYAWSVRAVGEKAALEWSAPSLFEVASGPGEVEFEEALAVVRTYLDGEGAASPGSALAETRAELESGPEASASSPVPAGFVNPQMTVEGGVVATSFTGDGSTLTDLNPSNLSVPVPVAKGGTGASDAATARENLSATSVAAFDEHEVEADAHHAPGIDITTTTMKGDLLVEDGTNVVRLGVGSDGQVLVADSSTTEGVAWETTARPCPCLRGYAGIFFSLTETPQECRDNDPTNKIFTFLKFGASPNQDEIFMQFDPGEGWQCRAVQNNAVQDAIANPSLTFSEAAACRQLILQRAADFGVPCT